MSEPLFVTGMLRSGTTLLQTLLSSHPQVHVEYQPFQRFLVDVKQQFLDEHGLEQQPPLDNGDPEFHARRIAFTQWLGQRTFNFAEATRLLGHAASAKGGGLNEFTPPPTAGGSFLDLYLALLAMLGDAKGKPSLKYRGSKEILCEEYLPFLLATGIKCTLILRDPRAVIASASHGRYRDMVGDRYPIMMLIRLWRKTAGYWLQYRNHPSLQCTRYEDLVLDTEDALAQAADWLGLAPFPLDLHGSRLMDPKGGDWRGNSSFDDKAGVDARSIEQWRQVLCDSDARFISSCCAHEMRAAGYPVPGDLSVMDIAHYEEDPTGVRASYLESNRVDEAVRNSEVERFILRTGDLDAIDPNAARHFIFPSAIAGNGGTH